MSSLLHKEGEVTSELDSSWVLLRFPKYFVIKPEYQKDVDMLSGVTLLGADGKNSHFLSSICTLISMRDLEAPDVHIL